MILRDILSQIFCSRGRPVEQFYWTSSVEMFITFFDEIGNSKTFEANLQNSSRRPVESRGRAIEILQGGPPDQMRFGPLYTLISVTTL